MANVLFMFIAFLIIISLVLIKLIFKFYSDLNMIKNMDSSCLDSLNLAKSEKLASLTKIKKIESIDTNNFDEITHQVNIKNISYVAESNDVLESLRKLAY